MGASHPHWHPVHEVRMNWNDTREIAEALYEKHPEIDPITIRFTDLHRWITELDGFDGDPSQSNEKLLEAVQMTWLDEWKIDHE